MGSFGRLTKEVKTTEAHKHSQRARSKIEALLAELKLHMRMGEYGDGAYGTDQSLFAATAQNISCLASATFHP
jgi:hypothetical protein